MTNPKRSVRAKRTPLFILEINIRNKHIIIITGETKSNCILALIIMRNPLDILFKKKNADIVKKKYKRARYCIAK